MDDAPDSYAAAAAELDAILDRLDRPEVDVDRLVADVARGADLLRWCRTFLAAATVEIDRVVAEIDENGGNAPDPPPDPAG